jgi:hypothetical protein
MTAHERPDGDERPLTPEAEFFAAYGATMIASVHVQYRLADIYSVHFDDPRTGSLPRVNEKWHEAVDGTLGSAFALADSALTPTMRVEVGLAVKARNYLAHFYILDTRALQKMPEGLAILSKQLMIGFQFFSDLGE